MPIYEYQCQNCNRQVEVMQKISDLPLTKCESCGGELKKLIGNTSFVLKGSGWYVTDYPSESRKKALDTKKSATDHKEEPGKKSDNKKVTAGT